MTTQQLETGSPLGLHRVLEPAGVLPQAAWKLDARREIWPDEVRVMVQRLNLDAASFRQLHDSTGGDSSAIKTAVLDIVSPCVTFNNHEGSTKSYPYAKSHEDPLHELGFVPYFDPVEVDYDAGATKVVELHDHSKITLKKLGHDYDPTNRAQALDLLHKANKEQLFLTGLIYYDKESQPMDKQMNLVDAPLATLPESRIRPSAETLGQIMEKFK